MKKAKDKQELRDSIVDGRFTLDGSELGDSKAWSDFYAHHLKLTSLVGFPSRITRNLYCHNNELTSLHNIHLHIKAVGNLLDLNNNPITSHVLGLLKIDGVKKVRLYNHYVEKIINRYLPLGDILDCAEELVENGFEEFAKL